MKSLIQRINQDALKKLREGNIPPPVDALNLVVLQDVKAYRLYGLLLAPQVLLMGGSIVYAGIHKKSIYGGKKADEVVIIRYPTHRTLLKIVCGKYYSWVNEWREKGVKNFEFSLTKQILGDKGIDNGGMNIFLSYNLKSGKNAEETLTALRLIFKEKNLEISYASYETGTLSIFDSPMPSDPNPAEYKNTAVINVDDIESIDDMFDGYFFEKMNITVGKFSMQAYGSMKLSDVLPWIKK